MLAACTAGDSPAELNSRKNSPLAADIFGNADYPAMAYGGYRGESREIAPTAAQLAEDMKILAAVGVKVLRTYNTSQFPQAALLLQVISDLKRSDPSFQMYVMLGAWIEASNAWTDTVDHSKGNQSNNSTEINTAVALANKYPDIVKAIAVGNEAMWPSAVEYFVSPKIILEWVTHLQSLKLNEELPEGVWITSSDNFESWGGGKKSFQTPELAALVKAVDFVSMHSYPFHDSFYNQEYWGVLGDEEELSKQAMTKAVMRRAVAYTASQHQAVVDYVSSLGIEKPIHVGETGWASKDSGVYGENGSRAADEYKQKLYYQYVREWSDQAGVTLFYFEIFDEIWKEPLDQAESENHFGLVRINNEVKYALWDLVDEGKFDELTRNGEPLVKSFHGDFSALLQAFQHPPFKSQRALKMISTTKPNSIAGEVVSEANYVIVHETMSPSRNTAARYPSAPLKLIAWEDTSEIEMSHHGIIKIVPRAGDWWGAGLELQSEVGENLSKFRTGHLSFEVRGDADVAFSIGFQTGRWLAGDQINNFTAFGPGTDYPVSDQWTRYRIAIADLDAGGDIGDVTTLLALLGQHGEVDKQIFLKNIYYSQD
ncbi:exo-beta-1,3-glucanase [Halieaceae bacterium IMCC14734]|uniref:Endo-1,3-beta-glucanase btgC n=2 Tax=Candidatus Litorirhabdus singularis TaxID=2518993 RepID=A0ABT3TFV3_9GAMM|nr:exo-beta-1,3-glucanase [Candidatus Litorirhabdus singularis]